MKRLSIQHGDRELVIWNDGRTVKPAAAETLAGDVKLATNSLRITLRAVAKGLSDQSIIHLTLRRPQVSYDPCAEGPS